MIERKPNNQSTKHEWVAPELVRLGSIRDIAGGRGAGAQSPVQLRS